MQIVWIICGLSILSIILGFIALLSQKIYIDSNTQELTQIKIPLIGKMKTNYPALVFVFIGFSLSLIAFEEAYPPKKVHWEVNGSFQSAVKDNNKEDKNFAIGTLAMFPIDFKVNVTQDGKFKIDAMIEEGKTFEEVVQAIDYSHYTLGSILILPAEEYNKYTNGNKDTKVKFATENMRRYKPIMLTNYQATEE